MIEKKRMIIFCQSQKYMVFCPSNLDHWRGGSKKLQMFTKIVDTTLLSHFLTHLKRMPRDSMARGFLMFYI